MSFIHPQNLSLSLSWGPICLLSVDLGHGGLGLGRGGGDVDLGLMPFLTRVHVGVLVNQDFLGASLLSR